MFFLFIVHIARPMKRYRLQCLSASPLALGRYSSRLANGGDIGKMSCVVLVIYILPDSHLWENRCITFHARVTGENSHTENRRN